MVDIKSVQENGIDILVVVGEIDASSSIELDQAIAAVVKGDSPHVLIDCSRLDYISSAGLGVFMSYIEEVKRKDGKMIICGLNEKVRNVFEILGLDQLLETVETREEGIKKLK